MYTLLHKKIKGKPYSIRHYRGFPKLFLENQALLGFHEAKTGVECGSWVTQAGHLVRLRQDERGQVWLEPVSELHLRRRLSLVANVVHATGAHNEQVWHVFPSLTLMRDVLAMDVWPFAPVEGIVETPIVRPA